MHGQAVVDGLSAYINGVQERSHKAERERAVAVAREAEHQKKRKVQMALALALALLMFGGGMVAFWRSEQVLESRKRHARNAEAVAGLLVQCQEALVAEDIDKANVLMEAAKKRSDEGGAEVIREQLERLAADLTLSIELASVDQRYWVGTDHSQQAGELKLVAREALMQFGVDPLATSLDAVVKRINESTVRDRIVLALDRQLIPERLWNWDELIAHQPIKFTSQMRDDLEAISPLSSGILKLLEKLDTDPYRYAIRSAVAANDRPRFLELVGQSEATQQPSSFTEFLGENLAIEVDRSRQLLKAALRRTPGKFGLLMALGYVDAERDEASGEQLRWFQAAVAAAPTNPWAHFSLGTALGNKKQHDDAITCFQKAIDLDDNFLQPKVNLAKALTLAGRHDEAIAWAQKMVESAPPQGYHALGDVYSVIGKSDEAIVSYQKAIELRPNWAQSYLGLSLLLRDKGNRDEAIVCCSKAIELDPKSAVAYLVLGNMLHGQGKNHEAVPVLKKSAALNPKLWAVHFNLASALVGIRQYDEALLSLNKALELVPNEESVLNDIGVLEREVALAAQVHGKFADFRVGRYEPASNEERLGLAALCCDHKLFVAAAGLYTDAFAIDAKLAEIHRYNAACLAALASSGQGADATDLDDLERTRLRRQAYDWLQAELAAYRSKLKSGLPDGQTFVQQRIKHWKTDSDLESIRDAQGMAKLPEGQQKAFSQLWSEAAELLMKSTAKPE